MSTALTTPMSFEEKLKTRIRESIGDLMSDEDLKKILDKGVNEALFERRTVQRSGWNGGTEQVPSLVDTVVKEHLEARMKTAIEDWVKANPDKLKEAVEHCLKIGIAGSVQYGMEYQFRSALSQLQQEVCNLASKLRT